MNCSRQWHTGQQCALAMTECTSAIHHLCNGTKGIQIVITVGDKRNASALSEYSAVEAESVSHVVHSVVASRIIFESLLLGFDSRTTNCPRRHLLLRTHRQYFASRGHSQVVMTLDTDDASLSHTCASSYFLFVYLCFNTIFFLCFIRCLFRAASWIIYRQNIRLRAVLTREHTIRCNSSWLFFMILNTSLSLSLSLVINLLTGSDMVFHLTSQVPINIPLKIHFKLRHVLPPFTDLLRISFGSSSIV